MKNFYGVLILAAALLCATTFLGCASVPKEKLDEKESAIQNLNTQIEVLNREIAGLKEKNSELMSANAELEKLLKETKTKAVRQERPVLKEK